MFHLLFCRTNLSKIRGRLYSITYGGGVSFVPSLLSKTVTQLDDFRATAGYLILSSNSACVLWCHWFFKLQCRHINKRRIIFHSYIKKQLRYICYYFGKCSYLLASIPVFIYIFLQYTTDFTSVVLEFGSSAYLSNLYTL